MGDDESGWNIDKLRFSEDKLYGRSSEVSQLLDSYHRLRKTAENGDERKNDVVLISGRTGVGKSALANQLRGPVKRHGGFFASGKFDRWHGETEPYSAITAAFSELCEQVLAADGMRSRMEVALRNEGSILFNAIPGLDNLIGSRASTATAASSYSLPCRFNFGSIEPQTSSSNVRMTESLPCRFKFARSPTPSAIVDLSESLSRRFELTGSLSRRFNSIGPQAPAVNASVSESRRRFNFAVRRFVRAVCEASHRQPLVLFLDDLQWADEHSLDLIQTLVSDKDNDSLLFIGCYRESEVDQVHPLLCLRDIANSDAIRIVSISVGNLSFDSTNEMISDVLSLDRDATKSLSGIVHNKTHGNAFFVIQFLKSLCDEGILEFSFGTMSWRWNEDKILNKAVSENVSDLMAMKLRTLCIDAQEVLKIASCLGSSFDISALVIVMKRLQVGGVTSAEADNGGSKSAFDHDDDPSQRNRILNILNEVMKEGLVEWENRTKEKYRFVHDQVQDAAFSLIPENRLEEILFRIGEAMVGGMSSEQLDEALYNAVSLMNHGGKVIAENTQKQLKLAKLNLKAGQNAMQISAFLPAVNYLKSGIEMLGCTGWVEHYDLCLDLHRSVIDSCYCDGNLNMMHEYANSLMGNARTFADKLSSYVTLIDSLTAEGKHHEAIDGGLGILDELGVKFLKPVSMTVIISLRRMKLLLRKRPVESLLDLPLMRDENLLTGMKFMDVLATPTFFVKPKLFRLLTLRMVRWSILHGVSNISCAAFAYYGVVLSSTGDFKGAYDFGKLALSLCERLNARELTARVSFLAHTFINPTTKPLQLSLDPLLRAYQDGMETGDVQNGLMSLHFVCQHSAIVGKPLRLLEGEIRTYCQHMKEYQHDVTYFLTALIWQFVLNLIGDGKRADIPSLVHLTGEALDQEIFIRRCRERNDPGSVCFLKDWQMQLAYYYRDFKLAGMLAREMKDIEMYLGGLFKKCRHFFFIGLVSAALAFDLKGRQRNKWTSRAEKSKERMRKWAQRGNVNCLHMALLLEAEHAAVCGRNGIARKKYDSAISTAGRAGWLHDKALSCERAALFYLRVNENDSKYWASYHMNQAHQLYLDWGANAKAFQLLVKHVDLISEESKAKSSGFARGIGRTSRDSAKNLFQRRSTCADLSLSRSSFISRNTIEEGDVSPRHHCALVPTCHTTAAA